MSEDAAVEPAAPQQPILRVVRGEPTPAELAALIAVVTAAAAGAGEPEPERPSPWSSREAAFRRPLAAGGDAWRWSGFTAGVRTRADW